MRVIGRRGSRALTVAVLCAAIAWAQAPGEIVELFRGAAEALSQKNADAFLEAFDKDMPGYELLKDEVEGLMNTAEVGSAIEVVDFRGDDQKKSVDLDWVLEITDQKARRQIVKCTIERKGKKWKITALDPVEFFKY